MDASPELETAVALAREFDLPVEQPEVLREGSSVIVLLSSSRRRSTTSWTRH